MAFKFICPYCNTESNIDDSLKGVEQECPACCENVVFQPATEKKCPHCAEIIKINAKICRFCNKPVYSYRKKCYEFWQTGLKTVKTKSVDGIEKLKKVIRKKTDTPDISDCSDIVKIDAASLFPASHIAADTITSAAPDSIEDESHFELRCPNCLNIVDAEREWCGMEAECPICKTSIIIPMAPSQKTYMSTGQNEVKAKTPKKRKTIIIASIVCVIVAAIATYVIVDHAHAPRQVQEQTVNVIANIRMKKIIPMAYLDFEKFLEYDKRQDILDNGFRYNINVYLDNGKGGLGKIIHTEKNVSYDYEMKDGIDIKVTVPKGRKICVTMQITDELRRFMRGHMGRSDVVLAPSVFYDIPADKNGKKISFVCDKFYTL